MVITRTLQTTHTDATHWSRSIVGRRAGHEPDGAVADLAGVRIGATQQDSRKLSKDPLFMDKVRDAVGLYVNPP